MILRNSASVTQLVQLKDKIYAKPLLYRIFSVRNKVRGKIHNGRFRNARHLTPSANLSRAVEKHIKNEV